MLARPHGVSTPWRSAPSAVRRLEDATDPKGRTRLFSGCRSAAVSNRLRRHLAQLANLQRSRLADPGTPTLDDPVTIPGPAAAT
jgi:hypothetical protein